MKGNNIKKISDEIEVYGCWRCGDIPDMLDPTKACQSCGDESIVTFKQALDIINDLHLKGHYQPEEDLYKELDFEEI